MKIRIGTRKSELALFQANFVKKKIIALGYDVEIVPIISWARSSNNGAFRHFIKQNIILFY